MLPRDPSAPEDPVEDNDEIQAEIVLRKSRSQKKRDAAALADMGGRMIELRDAELDALPLDSELRDAIVECRSLTKNARSRQLRWIAKLLRARDVAPLVAALESSARASREHIAAEREVTLWRERLLEGGDDALARFIDEHPDADRGQLRTLVRQANRLESSESTRTRARRELLRCIRALHLREPADGPKGG